VDSSTSSPMKQMQKTPNRLQRSMQKGSAAKSGSKSSVAFYENNLNVVSWN